MDEKNLHNYQKAGIEHILSNSHCGLFKDMGLGKTVTTLTAIKKLMFEELDISSALIIAPKRVAVTVWTEEVKVWDHLQNIKISRIIGTEQQRKKALAQKADIYTIGRDNVAWLCGLYGGLSLPFDMLVIDESSSFKNHKSLRFKALKLAQPSFKRVVLLTGTPAPNSLIDLWPQVYLLDRGERLGKLITHFRQKYFTEGQKNGSIVYNYRLQKGAEMEIHKKISDICISMKTEDYLELPGSVINDINIDFPAELQKKYDDFEKEKIFELLEKGEEGEEITALNAAALSNKLLQFANGAIYDEDKNYHEIHPLKLEACKEIVENAQGKPILIAWTYRHDMYRLTGYLKAYKPRELKTERDIKDWNAGKIRVLMMHPASGGHGLNLQKGGNIIIWFGQTWSLELYKQLNARLARQGQSEVVVIHRLVARKTLDMRVVKAIEGKDKGQEGLLAAIKAKVREYKKLFVNG